MLCRSIHILGLGMARKLCPNCSNQMRWSRVSRTDHTHDLLSGIWDDGSRDKDQCWVKWAQRKRPQACQSLETLLHYSLIFYVHDCAGFDSGALAEGRSSKWDLPVFLVSCDRLQDIHDPTWLLHTVLSYKNSPFLYRGEGWANQTWR